MRLIRSSQILGILSTCHALRSGRDRRRTDRVYAPVYGSRKYSHKLDVVAFLAAVPLAFLFGALLRACYLVGVS